MFGGIIIAHERGSSLIFNQVTLTAGLYLVATPIGNARDITLRALDVLASAEMLAAEDTRTLRKLLEIHGVPLAGRALVSYHDHSREGDRRRLLQAIVDGKSVAYASDAGTPLVADPGFALARDVIASGAKVHAIPGASAVLSALSVSGLPTDRFLFQGFPPPSEKLRRSLFSEINTLESTVVFYESPRRVRRLLEDLCQACGASRRVVICREVTKKFEEVLRGDLGSVLSQLDGRDLRGECVVLLGHPVDDPVATRDLEGALRDALASMRVKDAATLVAESFGVPKREVYQLALRLSEKE